MKVLLQEWWMLGKGTVNSISKDRAQLGAILDKEKAKAKEDGADPRGTPLEVEIPNDHAFVDMLEHGTVFLHDDEMDAITFL